MIRLTLAVLAGFMLAGVAFTVANPAYFSDQPARVHNGAFNVYSIQEAYDEDTGEPVYWITGAPVRHVYFFDAHFFGWVQGRGVKFFSIPRNKVLNPQAWNYSDFRYRLVIHNGEAEIQLQ